MIYATGIAAEDPSMDKPTRSPGPNDIPVAGRIRLRPGLRGDRCFRGGGASEAKTEPTTSQGVGSGAPASRPPDPFNPPSFMGSKPLAEPVVHKVVLGGGAESSPELLDRIRMASQEGQPWLRNRLRSCPPREIRGGGSRSCCGPWRSRRLADCRGEGRPRTADRAAPQKCWIHIVAAHVGVGIRGVSAGAGYKIAQPSPAFTPENRGGPPAPSAGGFTELLRCCAGRGSDDDLPAGIARGNRSASSGERAGIVHELFGSLGGNERRPSAPPPGERVDSSGGAADPFTRMCQWSRQRLPRRCRALNKASLSGIG